jgi:Fur family zinc uptake transcriptional regulator
MLASSDLPANHSPAVHALALAARLCDARGAQFTELRRRLLEMLWEAHQPLGAYEALRRLEGVWGRKIMPTTVYRGLDFLLEQGFAARIESRNAYVPCAHPDHPHTSMFFVCDQCSVSIEVENPMLEQLLKQDAGTLGFEVQRRVLELQGTCAKCLAAQ